MEIQTQNELKIFFIYADKTSSKWVRGHHCIVGLPPSELVSRGYPVVISNIECPETLLNALFQEILPSTFTTRLRRSSASSRSQITHNIHSAPNDVEKKTFSFIKIYTCVFHTSVILFHYSFRQKKSTWRHPHGSVL